MDLASLERNQVSTVKPATRGSSMETALKPDQCLFQWLANPRSIHSNCRSITLHRITKLEEEIDLKGHLASESLFLPGLVLPPLDLVKWRVPEVEGPSSHTEAAVL